MAQIILTGSGTWDLPADWNDANNVIEMYGAGGNGATSGSASFSGGGGAGGGYVKAVNVPLKASDIAGYVTDKTYNTGQFGGFWNGYQYDVDVSPVYGRLLVGGSGFNASGITGGNNQAASFCYIAGVSYATISRLGSLGGNGRASTTAAGGGGGGASGPDGVGGAGGSNTTTLPTVGRGGGGGNLGGAGSSTSATGGTSLYSGGAGGNGGSANASGSAGVSNPPVAGTFSPTYVSQTILVAGGSVTHNYNASTKTLSFSIYGGGSSVNDQTIYLDYNLSVTGTVSIAWDLTTSSDNFDGDEDAGFLFINNLQRDGLSGEMTHTGNLTLTTGSYPIRLWYRKGRYDTSGSDSFFGSLVFTGLTPIVYSGGGGGGAGDGTSGTSGGAGGNYGGGGGGSGSATNSVGGAGAPGIIIITYTPITPPDTGKSNFFMFF